MIEEMRDGTYRYTEHPVRLIKVVADDSCVGCYFHTENGPYPGYCQKERDSLYYQPCKGFIYATPEMVRAWNLDF